MVLMVGSEDGDCDRLRSITGDLGDRCWQGPQLIQWIEADRVLHRSFKLCVL